MSQPPPMPSSRPLGAVQPGSGASTRPDLETVSLPAKFGKYTLIRKLAPGGMAELFLAIQKSVAGFEKLLVIKRILPSLHKDPAFVEMLLHEARIAATLSHPNIVQTFDVGQVDGQFYIAMEHVHGEDLRSIVQQMKAKGIAQFPPEHALAIILGMCAGLSYAHEKRDLDGTPLDIVHRDVSPQNVIVTFSGDVKIVDFGVAKSTAFTLEQTKSGKIKGKVPYMSPEQARGEDIDSRSDVFSVGVMLFELTTGKRLFKGQSEYETLRLICEREYPRPTQVMSNYPADLDAIVMRALAKAPGQRYQSARELQADLEAFVRHHRVPVSNIGLTHFMQRLFDEKLAAQKQALLEGKHLADIIEMQHATATPPESAFDVDASGQRAVSTQSTPPGATRSVGPPPPDRSARRIGRVFALASFALLGSALGAAAYFVLRAPREDATAQAAAPAEAARGSLTVESDPPGASIWINGDLRREVTPATIDQLSADVALEVKLTMDGYEHEKRTVTLQPGATETVRAPLTRGSVVLDLKVSPPEVAPVFSIDGQVVLGPRILGLASGVSHRVSVSAPGYAEETLSVTGAPHETKQLEVVLVKKRDSGHTPSHEAVHGTARAQAAGVAATSKTSAPAGVPSATGKLNVGASGGWCNVSVDGAPRGATPVAGVELGAGPHKLTCTTEGGKTLHATVLITEGGLAKHKFELASP